MNMARGSLIHILKHTNVNRNNLIRPQEAEELMVELQVLHED